jgi:hypothetical protein
MAVDKWNGTGNWTTNANWSTGSPPNSSSIAEIQTGNADLTTAATVNRAVIDSGAQLTADTGGSLTVTNWLNNAGTLVTNAGGTVSIGGVFTNSGAADIGNTGLSASTTVTAAGLVNTAGTINVQGNASSGTTNQATLDITAAAPTTAAGFMRIGGDGLLEFASGGITSVGTGAQLELDGSQARVALASNTSSSTALTGLANNNGTLLLRGDSGLGAGGASLTTTTSFNNNASLDVDSFGNDGGSQVAFGGTLNNYGTTTIGNTGEGNNAGSGTSAIVTAASLNNVGTLIVQGNAASGTTNQATLNVTDVAPGSATGTIRVSGDGLLEFASGGATSIAANALLELDGSEARVALASNTSSSTALTGLASNNGTLLLRGNSGFGAGGASLTTTTGFTNNATLDVDSFGSDGGSSLAIGGTLTNYATVAIGNTGLSASDSVTATGLAANAGTIAVQGNAGAGSTNQATLNIGAAAPSSATSFIRVGGDGLLEFASGNITAISGGATLELDGSGARVALASNTSSSSALTTLQTNSGTLLLRGNSGFGAGGASLTTTMGFTNNGSLQVDSFGSDGGSNLSVGGRLVNNGTFTIGNTGLSASDTVTATLLTVNTGVTVQGNAGSGASNQATLNISAAAPGGLAGAIRVGGDGLLEYASGGFVAIAGGSTLELDGSEARVAIAGSLGTNSALTGLSGNNGTLLLRGNSGFGAGGASLGTTIGFTNNGSLQVDVFGSDGGSSLAIGGKLTNNGTLTIGNTGLSASTTVSATTLVATSGFTVQGNAGSGATAQATLNIGDVALATTTGYVRIGGDALLEFASGSIKTIGAGSTLELDGAQARVAVSSNVSTNSALTGFLKNNGTFLLRGDSGFGAGGPTVTTTTGVTNNGNLQIDVFGGDGGSSLTFGGTFSNASNVTVGNTGLSAATTLTANALINTGTLTLVGNASHLAEAVSNGNVTNTGTVTIGASTELDITGSHSFTQTAGTTTVAGLLAVNTVNANGGVIDFTSAITAGNGTGALRIGSAGTLEFDAAVDNSHTTTFTASTGTLALGAAGSFAATIAGFGSNDVIDLLGQTVTGLSYSGSSTSGVLTVSGSGGTIASLAFSGNYTTASFNFVSDGHGGTDILDPPTPSGHSAALFAQYGASMTTGDQGTTPIAPQDQTAQPQLHLAAHA